MATDDPIADLRKLLVSPIELTVGCKALQLRPFSLAKMPQVIEQIEAVKDYISIDTSGVDFQLAQLLAEQSGKALDLLELLSGESRPWIDGLAGDEQLVLLGAYIRINSDFFIQRLAPMLMLARSSLGMFASRSETPATSTASASAPQGAGATSPRS